MSYPFAEEKVPSVDTGQMVEVDRLMIEEYRIELIQMMENAGRCLAHLARSRFLDGDPRDRRVIVLAGTGGNGGGALVCARRLHNYGATVQAYITRQSGSFRPVPAHQLDILSRMGVPVHPAAGLSEAGPCDLVVDGLIGYSLSGAPRGSAREMIEWANQQGRPVLSLDAPSGLDTSSGVAHEPSVRAAATMTLALPKKGLFAPAVAELVGEIYLADISVPPGLYAGETLGLDVGPIFAESDIVRLR